MWTFTRACLDAIVKSASSGSGADSLTMGSWSIGLAKAAITPSVNTVLADITEADYTGYARLALGTMQAPFTDPAGLSLTESALKTFRPGSDTVPNTIYAGILLGSGAASQTLYGVEVLDAPVNLVDTHSLLSYVVRVGLPPIANYGISIVAP